MFRALLIDGVPQSLQDPSIKKRAARVVGCWMKAAKHRISGLRKKKTLTLGNIGLGPKMEEPQSAASLPGLGKSGGEGRRRFPETGLASCVCKLFFPNHPPNDWGRPLQR